MRTIPALAAVALAACSGDDDTDTAATVTACQGAGEAQIQAGSGGLNAFVPWVDGDAVQIADDGTGRYGFQAELLSNGLDTTDAVSTFLRFRTGDVAESQDVGANLQFQCPNEGPGWTAVFAPLADDYQDAAAVAALDGVALHLTVLATDQTAESTEQQLELVYAAP
ncbi:MAG: hypothetical protein R3F59_06110 [Myxococcota bacterium]